MPRYRVEITQWGRYSASALVEVEADSAADARDAAWDKTDEENLFSYDYDSEDSDTDAMEIR